MGLGIVLVLHYFFFLLFSPEWWVNDYWCQTESVAGK